MPYKELFYRRFGGPLSNFQKIEDWGRRHIPRPLFPLFVRLLDMLHQWWIQQRIKQEMRKVDREAKAIADQWVADDEATMLGVAVRKAELDHPDAKVEVIRPEPRRRGDPKPPPGILITHPPTPGNRIEQKLGFSELEIRAPHWTGPA